MYFIPIATYVSGSTVYSTASIVSIMCTNQHTMQAVLFSEPLHLYDIYISMFWIVCTFLATATSNERHCDNSTKKFISNTRDSATMTNITESGTILITVKQVKCDEKHIRYDSKITIIHTTINQTRYLQLIETYLHCNDFRIYYFNSCTDEWWL